MRVAEQVNGVIVNADSAQVYADLRVLSARPSKADEAALPHRLFGTVDGAEACDAARWAHDAKTALAEATAEGRVPILVGGTGLYQKTLLEGIAPIPEIDPGIRTEIRAMPPAKAYGRLKKADPEAAARININDTTRIARALEVIRSTGRTIGDWQKQKPGGIGDTIDLAPLILLPEREWLYARCNQRFETMFEDGGVAEVEALLKRNLDPELPVMRAIGVRDIADFIAGRATRQEAIAAAQQATRRYAKRQYTWFSNQFLAGRPRVGKAEYDKSVEQIVTKLRN